MSYLLQSIPYEGSFCPTGTILTKPDSTCTKQIDSIAFMQSVEGLHSKLINNLNLTSLQIQPRPQDKTSIWPNYMYNLKKSHYQLFNQISSVR